MKGIGSFLTLLLLFIAAAGFLLAQNMDLRQEWDRSEQARLAVEAQLAALRGEVARLQNELVTASGVTAQLQNELTVTRGQRDGLAAQVTLLQGQIAALQAELHRALVEVERLNRPDTTAAKFGPTSPAAEATPGGPNELDLAVAVMAAGALLMTLVLIGLVLSLPPAGIRRGR